MSTYNTNVYREQDGDTIVIGASGSLKYGDVAQTGCVRAGAHVATSGEASAGTLDISTGLSSVATFIVQVIRSDVDVHEDAVITESGGTLTVADGAATYSVTASDIVTWVAVGT